MNLQHVPPENPTIHQLQRPRFRTANRLQNLPQMPPQYRQLDGRQNHDRNPPPSQILLESQGLIPGQKDLDPAFFRRPQQRAILQPGLTPKRNREHFMRTQLQPQSVIQVLIQQHNHYAGCPLRACANAINRSICATVSEGNPSCKSATLSPKSKLFTIASGRIRVPRTIGRPDTFPGICSINSHSIQLISSRSIQRTPYPKV